MKTLIVIALATLALVGCSSAETQADRDTSFAHSENQLDSAQRHATVSCRDQPQCDEAWAATRSYVEQHSEMPVIRADALAIESDVPGSSGHAVYSATRVAKGGGATITLYAQCRGMYGADHAKGSDYDECVKKITTTQNGFALFLEQHLSSH
ncbi:hypothetical protein [Paraburkholderia sp.]|uniref:hypothetical protein n=1 Tax=Paraburkholderia sp. TaxID=1926495 RepID=UPI002F42AC47